MYFHGRATSYIMLQQLKQHESSLKEIESYKTYIYVLKLNKGLKTWPPLASYDDTATINRSTDASSCFGVLESERGSRAEDTLATLESQISH